MEKIFHYVELLQSDRNRDNYYRCQPYKKSKSFTNIPGYVIKIIYITNGSHIKQDIIFKLKNEFY